MLQPPGADTPSGACRLAAGRLRDAGLEPADAMIDAGVLARWILGWDAATWIMRAHDPAPAGFDAAFAAAIDRRAGREPVSQIIGEREFYGRPFRVTRDVLTPRPETELVVAEALARLASADGAAPDAPPLVIDVGTGSGCLAVTLALEVPECRVVATDVSSRAIDIARENAARHGAESVVTFHLTDLLPDAPGDVAMIVSNPPYVPARDRESLAPEVSRFEPSEALFAGPDGLDVIRRLVPAAARVLRPGGTLIFEIGQGQLDDVRAIVETAGLPLVESVNDLQGIPRVVIASRPA